MVDRDINTFRFYILSQPKPQSLRSLSTKLRKIFLLTRLDHQGRLVELQLWYAKCCKHLSEEFWHQLFQGDRKVYQAIITMVSNITNVLSNCTSFSCLIVSCWSVLSPFFGWPPEWPRSEVWQRML